MRGIQGVESGRYTGVESERCSWWRVMGNLGWKVKGAPVWRVHMSAHVLGWDKVTRDGEWQVFRVESKRYSRGGEWETQLSWDGE